MAPNEDCLSEGAEEHESDYGHDIGDINEEEDDDEDEDEISRKYFKSI